MSRSNDIVPFFYNTTGVTGPELKASIEAAKTQEEKVQAFFVANPNTLMIRDDVQFRVFPGIPCPIQLSSISRCLRGLTLKGILIHLKKVRSRSQYNRTVTSWVLKDQMSAELKDAIDEEMRRTDQPSLFDDPDPVGRETCEELEGLLKDYRLAMDARNPTAAAERRVKITQLCKDKNLPMPELNPKAKRKLVI